MLDKIKNDKKIFVPIVVVCSLFVGVFSAWLEIFSEKEFFPANEDFILSFGLFFGVVTVPWFLFLFRRQFSEKKFVLVSLGWVFASFLSFFGAFSLAVSMTGNCFDSFAPCFLTDGFNMPIAGVLGAFVVAIAFHLLFRRLNVFLFFLLCFSGGVIPMILWGSDSDSLFFGTWQGVIAAILGYAAVHNGRSVKNY